MGFAAAVSVPDGVAVAADSRVEASIMGRSSQVMSDTQPKIVPLSKTTLAVVPDPYVDRQDGGLMNLRSLLEQVQPDLSWDTGLEELISELPGRLASRGALTEEERQTMTLRLVGYSLEDRTVKVVILEGLDSEPSYRHSTANTGLDWFGYVDIASRIVNGRSAQDPENRQGWSYTIPTPLMSLDDALDLAETLVHTTATFAKFVRLMKPPGESEPLAHVIPVGGAVHSAFVTRHGVEWAKRPQWAPTPERVPLPGDRPPI